MQSIIFVGIGGFIGSILRYLLGKIPIALDFPLMTLIINFVGSFAIGFISQLSKDKSIVSPDFTLLLKIGICGGFTTFSTFSLDTVTLLQDSKYSAAFIYIFLSIVLCLLGTVAGIIFANAFKKLYS